MFSSEFEDGRGWTLGTLRRELIRRVRHRLGRRPRNDNVRPALASQPVSFPPSPPVPRPSSKL